MDREALRGHLPDRAAFDVLPEETCKAHIEETFEAILDVIDAEGREPDYLEQRALPHALHLTVNGVYLSAFDQLHATLLRAPDAAVGDVPTTMENLRRQLAYTRKQPVRKRR
jgi:hypothetical protein